MLEQTIVDRSMIRELIALSEPDHEFFYEMVELFLDKLSEIKKMLKLNINDLINSVELQQGYIANFHRMKGIGLNIGANQLASFCAAVEISAKNQDWYRIEDLCLHVIKCADQTEVEILQIAKELKEIM